MLREAVERRAVCKLVRSCSLLYSSRNGITETIMCYLLAKTRFSSRLLRHRNHPNEFAKSGSQRSFAASTRFPSFRVEPKRLTSAAMVANTLYLANSRIMAWPRTRGCCRAAHWRYGPSRKPLTRERVLATVDFLFNLGYALFTVLAPERWRTVVRAVHIHPYSQGGEGH
jgi:hypothetical protein